MLEDVIKIAKSAGSILMKHYTKDLSIKTKDHEFDFVTQADIEADKFIRDEINKLFPQDLILSEESDEMPEDFSKNVWMVDPLDGTKAFVNRNASFSVMIGLCKNGVPSLGVVYAPAKKILYYAEKSRGGICRI